MSALAANKMINLNPVPDEIVFITPDVKKLQLIHKNILNTNGIPYQYLQDDFVATVCGIDHKHLNQNRLGWLTRQWAQIHLDVLFPNSRYILTCDSDLIINRPLRLFEGGKINVFVETEHYEPYFKTLKQLLPTLTNFLPNGESFISELMLFVPDQLQIMRASMGVDHETWLQICLSNTPKEQCYAFSEYETVGTWMLNKQPSMINLIRSDTYGNNMQFHGKYKLTELLSFKSVIPLRSVYDIDIDWFN